MRDLDELFAVLGRSKFRSSFRLSDKDAKYLKDKGLQLVLEHGREFIRGRLAAAEPANDGRQTPMRNHPIFTAQHATATCCRKCLQKWHQIPSGQALSDVEISYIIEVLRRWLEYYE